VFDKVEVLLAAVFDGFKLIDDIVVDAIEDLALGV